MSAGKTSLRYITVTGASSYRPYRPTRSCTTRTFDWRCNRDISSLKEPADSRQLNCCYCFFVQTDAQLVGAVIVVSQQESLCNCCADLDGRHHRLTDDHSRTTIYPIRFARTSVLGSRTHVRRAPPSCRRREFQRPRPNLLDGVKWGC